MPAWGSEKTKPIKANFKAQNTLKGVEQGPDNDGRLAALPSFFMAFVHCRNSLFLVY